jgi:hypothetical protein
MVAVISRRREQDQRGVLYKPRGPSARKATWLKNQELGIGQVVLYKIVRGWAQQPNLGGRML